MCDVCTFGDEQDNLNLSTFECTLHEGPATPGPAVAMRHGLQLERGPWPMMGLMPSLFDKAWFSPFS
jgi:hypothetical protein